MKFLCATALNAGTRRGRLVFSRCAELQLPREPVEKENGGSNLVCETIQYQKVLWLSCYR